MQVCQYRQSSFFVVGPQLEEYLKINNNNNIGNEDEKQKQKSGNDVIVNCHEKEQTERNFLNIIPLSKCYFLEREIISLVLMLVFCVAILSWNIKTILETFVTVFLVSLMLRVSMFFINYMFGIRVGRRNQYYLRISSALGLMNAPPIHSWRLNNFDFNKNMQVLKSDSNCITWNHFKKVRFEDDLLHYMTILMENLSHFIETIDIAINCFRIESSLRFGLGPICKNISRFESSSLLISQKHNMNLFSQKSRFYMYDIVRSQAFSLVECIQTLSLDQSSEEIDNEISLLLESFLEIDNQSSQSFQNYDLTTIVSLLWPRSSPHSILLTIRNIGLARDRLKIFSSYCSFSFFQKASCDNKYDFDRKINCMKKCIAIGKEGIQYLYASFPIQERKELMKKHIIDSEKINNLGVFSELSANKIFNHEIEQMQLQIDAISVILWTLKSSFPEKSSPDICTQEWIKKLENMINKILFGFKNVQNLFYSQNEKGLCHETDLRITKQKETSNDELIQKTKEEFVHEELVVDSKYIPTNPISENSVMLSGMGNFNVISEKTKLKNDLPKPFPQSTFHHTQQTHLINELKDFLRQNRKCDDTPFQKTVDSGYFQNAQNKYALDEANVDLVFKQNAFLSKLDEALKNNILH